MTRHLIVNADDLGTSTGVNDGILVAADLGIVTSTSLLVRWPAAAAGAALASARPHLSVGLHVDLGEWVPDPGGGWTPRYVVVDTADVAADVAAEAVEREVERQLDAFVRLVGRPPTHLDGHQHVQRDEPVAGVLRRLAAALGVPLRLHDPSIRYRGEFYGQCHRGEPYPEGITVAALVRLIASLDDGWSELGCHPGFGLRPPGYGPEREIEVRSLCDPEVRQALEHHGVRLVSFHDLLASRPVAVTS